MQQIISRFSAKLLVSSFIILVCLFSPNSLALAAWSAPTSAPPNGNPEVPVNTSATAQTKSGDLTLGGLGTFSSGLGIAGGSFGFLPSGSLKFMLPFDMAAPAVGSLLVSTDTSGTAAWAATSTLGLGGGAGVTWPLFATAGLPSAPSYSFAGNATTGIYSPGANSVSVVTDGAVRLNIGSTGIVSVSPSINNAWGSSATPSYSFSSRTNTGMYSPAANTLGLVTNGADRMTISSTGNIGVGTTAPLSTALLDLTSTTRGFLPPRLTTAQRDAIASPANGLVIFNTTSNQHEGRTSAGWVALGGGGGGSSTFLGLTDTPGSYAGQAGRVVAVNAGANALEFVNIAPGGGPGTGTINKLPKWGTTNSLADSSITDAGSSVDFTSPITNTSGAVFNTGGAATGLIVSAGNVGLGTATPGAKLEVAGQVKITGGSPGANKVLTSDATGLATWQTPASGGISTLNALSTADQTFAVGTSGTNFNISSSGSTHTFNLPDASASARGLISTLSQTFAGNKTFSSAIYGAIGGANSPGYAFNGRATTGLFSPALDTVGLATGGTERLRINSSGDVGLGTATPGAKLEVAGQVKITGGSPGANKVLTSDATGLASWTDPSVGSSQWTTAGSNVHYNGGNVGVGVNPSTNLHVYTAGGSAEAQVQANAGGSNEARLELRSGTAASGEAWRLFSRASDNNFGIFRVGSDTKFRINPNGSGVMALMETGGTVGVGTNSPSSAVKFHVNGNSLLGGTTFFGGFAGPNISATGINLAGQNISMGYEVVQQQTANVASLYVNCSSGKRVIGGGCNTTPGVLISSSHPNGDNQWRCVTSSATTLTAFAICANI